MQLAGRASFSEPSDLTLIQLCLLGRNVKTAEKLSNPAYSYALCSSEFKHFLAFSHLGDICTGQKNHLNSNSPYTLVVEILLI